MAQQRNSAGAKRQNGGAFGGAKRAFAVAMIVGWALCGCGSQWVANQADWLMLRELNEWLELSDEQREWLRPRLKAHVEWIRGRWTPRLAVHLEGARDRLADGIQPPDLDWMWAVIDAEVKFAWGQVRADVVALLAGLDASQVERLGRKMQESRKSWIEAIAQSPQERLEERVKATESWVQSLFGRLGATELRAVREAVARLPDNVEQRYARVRAQQDKWLAAVAAGKAEEAARLVDGWLKKPGIRPRKPAREALSIAVSSVSHVLSGHHFAHAQNKMGEWIGWLKRFARGDGK